jgi:hypothetical protein
MTRLAFPGHTNHAAKHPECCARTWACNGSRASAGKASGPADPPRTPIPNRNSLSRPMEGADAQEHEILGGNPQ